MTAIGASRYLKSPSHLNVYKYKYKKWLESEQAMLFK